MKETVPKSLDKHLNLFWNYNGNPHWEDNITKAFINTLSMSSKKVQTKMINFLLKEELVSSDEDMTIRYDLQNPYVRDIKNLSCKKYLIGISPTGKVWGNDLIEIFNKLNLDDINLENIGSIKYLKDLMGNVFREEKKEELQEAIRSRKLRGDSRLDAWIFIYNKSNLEIIIAIELKLWDLDPYQLDNHLEKSLGLKSNKSYYLYKFEDICQNLKKDKFNNQDIRWHFLDYMEKLKYFINTQEITEEDLKYVIYNDDSSILQKKWNRYLKSYFKSREFNILKEVYGLEETEDKNYVHVKKIGKLGNIYFDSMFDFKEYPIKKIKFFL